MKCYCAQVKQQLTDQSEAVVNSVVADVIVSSLADVAAAYPPLLPKKTFPPPPETQVC